MTQGKETHAMRKRIWWGLLAVGIVAIVGGLIMRRSTDVSTQQLGSTIGWTGVALAVAARVILRMLPRA
jgi:uncharacterized membrane protein HdeD (DUF308 family)